MIYHVTPSYPPKLGGLEKVVQVLATTQSQQGLRTAVITSSQDADAGKTIEAIPVSRLRSFALASTTFMPGLPWQLLKIRRTDTVQLHITQAFTPEMVWLAAKIKGFAYVAQIHIDAPAAGWAGFLLKVYKPVFLARVLRSAKYVAVFTEDQRQAVHQKYRVELDRITVIPNGVEAEFYSNKKRTLSAKPKLLFVGRLGFQKDIPLLLHALQGISEKFQTTLVGDGELKTELQNLSRTLELKNVTFAGRASGAKLRAYYDQASMFVLTSEREGMPLVLLEAMAMGLPIIATNVIGTRDVVVDEKNGLLVPYGNADAFRAALIRLGKDKQLYTKLHTASRVMAKQYAWEKISQQFMTLYEEQS